MLNRKHLGLVLALVTLVPVGARGDGPATSDRWLASTLRYYGLAERATAGDRVTLPGFGGSATPPRPGVLDFAKPPWFDGAKRGVLDLIKTAKLDRPFVLGTQVGSYARYDPQAETCGHTSAGSVVV